jgi:hypothetical protein
MTSAAAILDFYDDSNHELMSKVAMPTELQNVDVTVLTPDQHSNLADNEFGLVFLTKRASVFRKFPVNDPGNAWLSAQYFDSTYEKLAFPARFIAAKFIKEACDAYGVPSSRRVESYAARVEPSEAGSNVFIEGSEQGWMLRKFAQRELTEKTASVAETNAILNMPNEHFAMVIKTADGAVIRKYAMPDAGHVKLAANYFDQYAMDLPPEHRHRFASAVNHRADELDVDVSDNDALQKWAGTDWNKQLHAHIEQRKSLLPMNQGARGVLDKLAASLSETTPVDMAAALQTVDQATGLDRYYDNGLADPYASAMSKEAMGWSMEVDGHTVTETDLRKEATIKKISGYMGSVFARQFSESPAEIFESLPVTEQSLIKQIVSGEA